MKQMFLDRRLSTLRFASAGLALGALVACGDDPVVPPASATFTLSIENVSTGYDFAASGVFDTPVGATDPGAIGPGGAYEFSFSAPPGSSLSFATMFVPSNDFFFAPDGDGIALWDAQGMPVSGDVTAQVFLWDAGTEVNQEPGVGADQVQRQGAANTGAADPTAMVRPAPDDFTNLPDVADVIEVTVTSQGASMFRVRIENVSTATTLTTSVDTQAVPLSPGVWVVHNGSDPLFTDGEADRDEGLEGIAEDGAAAGLASELAARTGLTVPLAPGVFVVHDMADPLFTEGAADFGDGLEAIAEDGDPSGLAAALTAAGFTTSGVFNTPVGASAPSAIGPGGRYEVTFDASDGDMLSFATMFVASNDLFYAPDGMGIELFTMPGSAVSGDITSELYLWDVGSEVNQEPGVGTNQAMFQSGPNSGPAEGGTVRRISAVTDGFTYPATTSVIRVTITPSS